jgi:hypothetical protein
MILCFRRCDCPRRLLVRSFLLPLLHFAVGSSGLSRHRVERRSGRRGTKIGHGIKSFCTPQPLRPNRFWKASSAFSSPPRLAVTVPKVSRKQFFSLLWHLREPPQRAQPSFFARSVRPPLSSFSLSLSLSLLLLSSLFALQTGTSSSEISRMDSWNSSGLSRQNRVDSSPTHRPRDSVRLPSSPCSRQATSSKLAALSEST